MGKANRLSKRLDWQKRVEKNNEDQKLIKPEQVKGAETIIEKGNLKERIKSTQEEDKKIVKAVEEIKKAEIKTLRNEEQKIKDGIVIKEEKIYVLERELKRKVI